MLSLRKTRPDPGSLSFGEGESLANSFRLSIAYHSMHFLICVLVVVRLGSEGAAAEIQ